MKLDQTWSDFGAALYEIGFDGIISMETVIPQKLPDALREFEEINLAQKARYIASLASGQ